MLISRCLTRGKFGKQGGGGRFCHLKSLFFIEFIITLLIISQFDFRFLKAVYREIFGLGIILAFSTTDFINDGFTFIRKLGTIFIEV